MTAGGVVKSQFGNKRITLTRDEKKEVSLGDDLKAATTDAIKKCATLFGVGLHLYFETPPPAAVVSVAERSTAPSSPPPAENGGERRLSAKQLNAIFGIAKGAGWSKKEIQAFSLEHFGKQPDFISSRDASAYIDHLKGVKL